MAGNTVAGFDFLHFRGAFTAFVAGIGAACMEHTSLETLSILRQFASQRNLAFLPLEIRNGGKQSLCIGMQCIGKQFLRLCLLHQGSQAHNTDAVRNIPHNTDVMGDKQQTQVHFTLEPGQHIQNLGLDGNVQRRNRLITDDQFRIDDHGPGNTQTLYLATGYVGATAGSQRQNHGQSQQQIYQKILPCSVFYYFTLLPGH